MKLCHVVKTFSRISVVYLSILQITDAAFLRCYNGSLEDYIAAPLYQQLPPSFLSCLDSNLPTVIYTFGYNGRVAGLGTTSVLSAYIATRKRNVLLLDWEEEAKSGLLGLPLGYVFSAFPKSIKIGNEMGDRLIDIVEAGNNMTNIHLMGHSLGAHVMAYAGKRSREKGHIVSRITGLDPARAFFEGTFAVGRGLDRTCAKFVVNIHTDPGGYGFSTSTGTVDIWPNCIHAGCQPGCVPGDYPMLSPEDRCSHDRSWQLYVETIASPTALLAVAAPDYNTWVTNNADSQVTIYVGDLTSTSAKGNFYLSTNSKPPYSRGPEGLKPNEAQTDSQRSLTRLFNYFS